MSAAQIHGAQAFDRPRRRAYPANPSLQVQFHAPVRYSAIHGPYHLSVQLEAPAVVWGPNGRFWGFLHDFEPQAVALILADYRAASYERRGEFGRPFGGGR